MKKQRVAITDLPKLLPYGWRRELARKLRVTPPAITRAMLPRKHPEFLTSYEIAAALERLTHSGYRRVFLETFAKRRARKQELQAQMRELMESK
jgi:hypothetical protein